MNFVLKIVGLYMAIILVFASKTADVHDELVIRTKRYFFSKESFKDNDPLQNGLDSLDLLVDSVNKSNVTCNTKESGPKSTVSIQNALLTQKKIDEQTSYEKLTILRKKQDISSSVEAVVVASFLTRKRGAIRVQK